MFTISSPSSIGFSVTYGSTPGSLSTPPWRGTSLATFGSKKQPPVWYLKARAPVWYLKARTPPLPVLTGLHLGLPLPPSGVVPLWPLSSLGNSPQSGISKPEPPVWYLKARAPPLSCLLLGLPLLPRGVEWQNVLLGAHGYHLQGLVQWNAFQHEEEA